MVLLKNFATILILVICVLLAACTPQAVELPETSVGQTPQVNTPVPSPGAGDTQTPAVETAIPSPFPTDPLANTKWRLDSFGPAGSETPVIAGTNVTLEFGEDGQAGGSGGCNSYGTPYQVQGNSISFGQVTTTEKACLQEGVMDQEQRYYQALQAAGEFELTDGRLIISYDDGKGALLFVES